MVQMQPSATPFQRETSLCSDEMAVFNWYLCTNLSSHSGAEGILGKVVRSDQVSYLSESVSTSRFGICKSLNISLGSERENTRFVRSNGRKTTFEWPKVVSELSFPSFWGVFRSIKVVSVFRFGDRKCRF